jgi:hypothetical protein
MMFRSCGSSNFDGESSGSQTNEKVDVRARGENGPSKQGNIRPPGRDGYTDEQSEDDDDKRPPPDRPAPEVDPCHREVTHDTDIRLKILNDGQDKGDFIELETSVKVCGVT